MAFTNITSTDLSGKGVVGIPNTPQLTTTEMQKKFDEIDLDVVVPKHQTLVTELNADDAATNLHGTDPTTSSVGTLQAIITNLHTIITANVAARHTHDNKALLDTYTQTEANLAKAVTDDHSHSNKTLLDATTASYTTADKTALDANTAARHTHDNKSVLDLITSTVKAGYDSVVTLLSGITGAETTVTNDDTKLTTGSAIVKYVTALGGGDMTKAVYDTDNDGIVDAAENATALESHAASYFATAEALSTETSNRTTAISSAVLATLGVVATVESSTTASKAYAINDYLVYSGTLYKVTASIAQGGTLTVGTNISATTVAAEISTQNSNLNKMISITVTCDDQLVGKTITCSQDSTTYSAVVDSTKIVKFNVPTLGYWTLYNPVTAAKTYVSVNYYGAYTAEMYCYKVYGVDINFAASEPTSMCTYTDDAVGETAGISNWRSKQIFALLKNCILNSSGKVLGYLKDADLTKYEDGTAADITTLGNDVMLEIGARIGYSIEWDSSNTSILHVKVTDNPSNASYTYDAFSLDSYNDCDKIYIGVFKGTVSASMLYSSSGRGVTVSQTIDTFRTYARNRGTGYQQRSYGSLKLMQCLYLIAHKTLNSQAAVGYGYVASGHSAGVSTGGTNAYGFDSEVIKASNASYMTDQNHQVKCLGLEDFWGNYWEFIDGLCTDASRNVLTCKCAANFDTDGTSYDNNGNGGVSANIGNYMSKPQGGSNAGFTPVAVAGSDSTYFCDSAALYASCLAIFGGDWDNASCAGAFLLNVGNAFSWSDANVACRLMYLHKASA